MSDTRHSAVPLTRRPRLIRDRFELECVRRRLYTGTQRAKALGISTAQLSKVLRGDRHPGGQFIHACMELFNDCDYEDLFTDAADHDAPRKQR